MPLISTRSGMWILGRISKDANTGNPANTLAFSGSAASTVTVDSAKGTTTAINNTGTGTLTVTVAGTEGTSNADVLTLGGTGTIIVTGEDHRFLASEQLREIGVELGCALLEALSSP